MAGSLHALEIKKISKSGKRVSIAHEADISENDLLLVIDKEKRRVAVIKAEKCSVDNCVCTVEKTYSGKKIKVNDRALLVVTGRNEIRAVGGILRVPYGGAGYFRKLTQRGILGGNFLFLKGDVGKIAVSGTSMTAEFDWIFSQQGNLQYYWATEIGMMNLKLDFSKFGLNDTKTMQAFDGSFSAGVRYNLGYSFMGYLSGGGGYNTLSSIVTAGNSRYKTDIGGIHLQGRIGLAYLF